ncbi:MAG: hypothetical protein AAGA32_18085 [Pseudomonadota bacterium]
MAPLGTHIRRLAGHAEPALIRAKTADRRDRWSPRMPTRAADFDRCAHSDATPNRVALV